MAQRPINSKPDRRFDIREYKKNLRLRYRKMRKSMHPEKKKEKEQAIFRHISHMPAYQNCKVVLSYVSTAEEIDTHAFIEQCIREGKTVGVPYCIAGTREMDFYQINSLDDLERRTFGVLEPVAEKSIKMTDFSQSICILPGISFDHKGYRLGYGGGYYDRFLSQKYDGGFKIGVCYQSSIRPHLAHGRYDVPCDYIVTERGVRKAKKSMPHKQNSSKKNNHSKSNSKKTNKHKRY